MSTSSTIMSEQEYLQKRLEDQISWHDRKSSRNKSFFQRLQVGQIVVAALIPLLSTTLTDGTTWFKGPWLVAVLGVVIMIITGLQSLYRFQDLWIEYRTTAETLKNEQILYLTRAGPYAIANPFPVLVERVEAILSQQHSRWLGRVQQEQLPSGADKTASNEK